MRNLKKLLSVVLVVAMIAGLCAVGSFSAAAAEYSEVTNYKEAAAVITGVGVMDGYEDGTMQYDKTVTREEAAAIICRALIGVDTAKKLSTAVAPFADVAANRWSAPYINYLKAQGIVNGKTATQFDPTAEVTAVEFAKMMLCAVGYGKAGEFVGASWDVNTITAANNNGVYTGTLATDLTAPATREQCMLYAFNTMTRVPVVNYNSAFQSYYVGTSITSGLDGRVAENDIGKANVGTNYDYTLAYRNFKLERTNALGNTDEYGRPAVKWTANGKTVAEDVCSKTANYVLTGTVANATIYNTLGSAVAKNLNKNIWDDSNSVIDTDASDVFEIYKNGEKLTGAAYNAIMTAALAGDSFFANTVSGNGDTVEFYVSTFDSTVANAYNKGDYKVTVVVTSEFFGQVTAVSSTKLTVSVKDSTGTVNVDVKADDVNIAGFAKKDYVLLNICNPRTTTAKVTKISAAKAPVVGTYGGTNSMRQHLIDNVGIGASAVVSTTLNGLTSGSQYSFWYDNMGNVIYAELYQDGASSDLSRYAYLKNIRCATTSASYEKDFEVQLVYSDGKSEWVHYDVDPNSGAYKFDGTTYYVYGSATVGGESYYQISTTNPSTATTPATPAEIKSQFANKFYTFTKANDKVVLKNISATNAAQSTGNVTLNSKTGVQFGNYGSNSATKVVVVDASGNVVNFNGESKFNDTTYNTVSYLYTYDKDSTKIKNIFVYSATTITSSVKAFYVGSSRKDSNYGYLNLYIDGSYIADAKVDLDDYAYFNDMFDSNNNLNMNYNWGGAKVFDVTISGDLYDLSPASLDAGKNEVMRNNGTLATATDLAPAYGNFVFDKLAVTPHYAWATIDTVDNNAFWTAEADAGSPEAGNYSTAPAVNAHKYYTDSSTIIYDCTMAGQGKIVTSVEAGQYFIALTADGSYGNTSSYCEYIWIVD